MILSDTTFFFWKLPVWLLLQSVPLVSPVSCSGCHSCGLAGLKLSSLRVSKFPDLFLHGAQSEHTKLWNQAITEPSFDTYPHPKGAVCNPWMVNWEETSQILLFVPNCHLAGWAQYLGLPRVSKRGYRTLITVNFNILHNVMQENVVINKLELRKWPSCPKSFAIFTEESRNAFLIFQKEVVEYTCWEEVPEGASLFSYRLQTCAIKVCSWDCYKVP